MGGQGCKAADADCQSPRGPAVGQRNGPDRCRSPIPAGCGCRNYSHPNPAADHLACGIKSGNADAQFQATAGAERVIFHLLLEGITSGEADIIVSKRLAKRDRPLIADHMIAGGNEHQPVFGNGKRLQFFGRIDLVPDDTDLGSGRWRARSRGWNAPPDRSAKALRDPPGGITPAAALGHSGGGGARFRATGCKGPRRQRSRNRPAGPGSARPPTPRNRGSLPIPATGS
jgi:hypothetical protein